MGVRKEGVENVIGVCSFMLACNDERKSCFCWDCSGSVEVDFYNMEFMSKMKLRNIGDT